MSYTHQAKDGFGSVMMAYYDAQIFCVDGVGFAVSAPVAFAGAQALRRQHYRRPPSSCASPPRRRGVATGTGVPRSAAGFAERLRAGGPHPQSGRLRRVGAHRQQLRRAGRDARCKERALTQSRGRRSREVDYGLGNSLRDRDGVPSRGSGAVLRACRANAELARLHGAHPASAPVLAAVPDRAGRQPAGLRRDPSRRPAMAEARRHLSRRRRRDSRSTMSGSAARIRSSLRPS